jgi:hypothetical protein
VRYQNQPGALHKALGQRCSPTSQLSSSLSIRNGRANHNHKQYKCLNAPHRSQANVLQQLTARAFFVLFEYEPFLLPMCPIASLRSMPGSPYCE